MSEMVTETAAKLMSHEAVCAERYKGINDQLVKGSERMNKMEYLMYAVLAAVLIGPGSAAEFFKKFIGL